MTTENAKTKRSRGRPKVEIDPVCGQRLREWREYIGMKQEELAMVLNVDPIHVSNIERGKRSLTLENAVLIEDRTGYRDKLGRVVQVRHEWLLNHGKCMTNTALDDELLDKRVVLRNAALEILGNAINKVCHAEEIRRGSAAAADIQITPEDYKVMQNALLEQAEFIAWSFIKNRKYSPLWALRDCGAIGTGDE